MKRIFFAVIYVVLITAATCSLGGCSLRPSKKAYGKPKKYELINTQEKDNEEKQDREPQALYAALEEGFSEEYIIINTYTMSVGYTDAEAFILTRMRYVSKAKMLRELLPKAIDAMYTQAQAEYSGKSIKRIENIVYPTWQYLAATMLYAQDEEYLLYDILGLEINVNEKDAEVEIEVKTQIPSIIDFAQERAGEKKEQEKANTYLNIRYTYAYLSALYDEEGNYSELPYPKQVEQQIEALNGPTGMPQDVTASELLAQPQSKYYSFDPKYLQTLVYPLDEIPNFRDTWAQGRSNNTRQHTGTDMQNKEGKNIYAISGGTVLYKSTDKIPGNYVIILDDYGYEYHYYHLVELPTEVEAGNRVNAGDLIAHVGNTGNSDTSHLHLTLIAPDGSFINPYGLMRTLADNKKQQDGE